jgi:hypothetical protein
LGLSDAPRDIPFRDDERGLENGCASPVEVAVGGPAVRGEVRVAVADSWDGRVDENARANEDWGRRADVRRRHRAQIMVVVSLWSFRWC